jgi:hypothetical protein
LRGFLTLFSIPMQDHKPLFDIYEVEKSHVTGLQLPKFALYPSGMWHYKFMAEFRQQS